MPEPLYRRLLGREAFDALPPLLRDFHAKGGRAQGTANIDGATTRVGRALARRAGLPPAGEIISVALEITPEGERERWRRWFGDSLFETEQWLESGLLHERAGPFTFRFNLKHWVADGWCHLQFTSSRLRFGPLPGPRLLAPRPWGIVRCGPDWDFWGVIVSVYAPGLGLLCGYDGTMRPV